MSEVPDLGPVPQRITVSPEQARALVVDQFPQTFLELTATADRSAA